MRSRLALASVSAVLVLVAGACTNLLGTFTTGDGGTPDANNGDAPGDGPPVVGISCEETSTTRTPVTTGGALHTQQIRMAELAGNRIRIVAVDIQQAGNLGLSAVVQAYTVDGNHSVTTATPLQTNAGQVYSITRYATGFAALYEANDTNTNKPYLFAAHIEDASGAWSTPVELVESPNAGGIGTHDATFVAIDGATDNYMVAYAFASGATEYVWLGPLSPGDQSKFAQAATFPSLNTDQSSYNFQPPAIAFQPGNPPMVMMAPNGDKGPPAQGTPVKIVMPNSTGFDLTPPSDLNFFPYAFAPAVVPTKANLAMLVANLGTFKGGTHVGQVDYTALKGSFDPQTLTETALTDGGQVQLKDLFIGNVNAHWEVAGTSGEQLVMISGPFDPLQGTTSNGLNFGWWDGASGTNRIYDTGDNALAPDVTNVAAADATFQTLVGSIAGFATAYVSDVSQPQQGGGGQPVAGDLYLTGIACQPK